MTPLVAVIQRAAPLDWHMLGELMKDFAALLVGAAQLVRALRPRIRARRRTAKN